MNILPFAVEHLSRLSPQAAQLGEVTADALAGPYGQAWTAEVDGAPICCAGLMPVWDGRAYAWALLSKNSGKYMVPLTRAIRSRLSVAGFRRVEMAVDSTFGAGCRWAGLLGFRLETPFPMRAYLPNGRDAYLYARA